MAEEYSTYMILFLKQKILSDCWIGLETRYVHGSVCEFEESGLKVVSEYLSFYLFKDQSL